MPNSDDRHHKPDHKPPGQQPPGGGNIGHVTSFDSGSYELRIAEAIIGGSFVHEVARVTSTEVGGGEGTRRFILLSPAPFSVEGAVGIIG